LAPDEFAARRLLLNKQNLYSVEKANIFSINVIIGVAHLLFTKQNSSKGRKICWR